MAALVVLIAIAALFGVLLGGIAVISWAIHREDRRGSLIRRAPNWSCRGARWATGMHAARWDDPATWDTARPDDSEQEDIPAYA